MNQAYQTTICAKSLVNQGFIVWKCLISLSYLQNKAQRKQSTRLKRPEQQHLAMDIADYSFLLACAT